MKHSKQYQIRLLKKYIPILKNKKILEVGIGNGKTSKHLTKLFDNYTGIDPNDKLIRKAKLVCSMINCNTKYITSSIEKYITTEKYDLIIFLNSFHLVDFTIAIEKIKTILNKNGIVFIDEPKPLPYKWPSNELNKNSSHFSATIWNKKKEKIKKATEKILLLPQYYRDYHVFTHRHVYILKHLS